MNEIRDLHGGIAIFVVGHKIKWSGRWPFSDGASNLPLQLVNRPVSEWPCPAP